MSIRYIFFDLDGTLLPMDQDRFIASYFHSLCSYMQPYGFEPQAFSKSIWQGTAAMFKNNGSKTNEEVFWSVLTDIYGAQIRQCEPVFERFYQERFPQVQSACGFEPKTAQTIARLKDMGYQLVLATQPIFPSIATETRMKWAGAEQADFLHYTTYENSRFCKPNPDYYREILRTIGAQPSECLMVGNDALEDLVAETVGMKVFLLTDCLINKTEKDISGYPQGDLDALMHYIQSM